MLFDQYQISNPYINTSLPVNHYIKGLYQLDDMFDISKQITSINEHITNTVEKKQIFAHFNFLIHQVDSLDRPLIFLYCHKQRTRLDIIIYVVMNRKQCPRIHNHAQRLMFVNRNLK